MPTNTKRLNTITTKALTLRQLMQKTPKDVQYRAEDTRIVNARKIIDSDTKQPTVLGVVVSTHDSEGNIMKKPRNHRCFIMGLEGPGKKIGNSRVRLSCDCEFFMYVCEVALSKKGNAEILFSNGKPAVVRNPTNRPYVCKHLFHLAESILERGL